MELRDEFAAAALTGMLAHGARQQKDPQRLDVTAVLAYSAADAMLKVRQELTIKQQLTTE